MAAIEQPGGVVDLGDIGPDRVVPGDRHMLKYDPKQVKLIFGGLPMHIGVAAGTFITVERAMPSYRLVKGTDGEGTRIRTQNFSARLQLTLRSGGGVNDALSLISASDELTAGMALPLFLVDRSGRSKYMAPIAFLEAPTDPSFGTSEGSNTWTWICDTWFPYTGGSDKAVPRPS